MHYAILCYDSEQVVGAWTKEADDVVMADLQGVQQTIAAQGRLGPVARLGATAGAKTVRKGGGSLSVLDGPFAEAKEVLLGFFVVDADSVDHAVEMAKDLARVNPGVGGYEIRAMAYYQAAPTPPAV